MSCKSLGVVALFVFPSYATGQQQGSAVDYKEYAAAIRGTGFTPLVPASTKFVPGYVYRLVKNNQGKPFPQTVCARLFDTESVASSQALPSLKRVRGGSLKFSLSFLPDFLAKAVEAAFGIDTSKSTTTEMSFEDIITSEIPQANVIDTETSTVVPRTVNRLCLANLKMLSSRKDKSFVQPVFIVIRSSEAKVLQFVLDKDNKTSISASASAAKIASSTFGWASNGSGKQSLKLEKSSDKNPFYFAADVVKLTSIARLPQISSEVRATLSVNTPTAAEKQALSREPS
jgi:hypothetical protein